MNSNVRRIGTPAYHLYEIDDFLTREECRQVIEIAKRHGMHRSEIYGASSDSVDNNSRNSFTAWIPTGTAPIVQKISTLTSQLTNLPEENQEDLQVLRYPEGGFFSPHYDCCDGGEQECNRMNAVGGPRRITLIIYLNDDYANGETEFPNLGIKIKPKTGKAAVFWSTSDDGEVLRQSFHGGNPVVGGEKWICNKWIHPRRYRQF